MNGGVSLAVWMGGVACEIDNVRRASNGIPPRDGATEQEKTVHELWARATQRAGTALDSLFGLDGHYVRIGPDPQYGLARIANLWGARIVPLAVTWAFRRLARIR